MDRYTYLSGKESAGTITDSEYDEMFHLEQDSAYEDCLRMSQLGI